MSCSFSSCSLILKTEEESFNLPRDIALARTKFSFSEETCTRCCFSWIKNRIYEAWGCAGLTCLIWGLVEHDETASLIGTVSFALEGLVMWIDRKIERIDSDEVTFRALDHPYFMQYLRDLKIQEIRQKEFVNYYSQFVKGDLQSLQEETPSQLASV